jgi:flagellar secretion chaperone FliS
MMYGAAAAAGQYRAQAVETAPPAQLVLMLYDGALAAITRVEQTLGLPQETPGRLEMINTELQRAQRIIEELLYSLDRDQGGAIARNLTSLYSFCLEQLTATNIRKDPTELPAVRDVLSGLRDAWEQACCHTPAAAGA